MKTFIHILAIIMLVQAVEDWWPKYTETIYQENGTDVTIKRRQVNITYIP